MFKFLLWHVLLVFGSCELYKDESRYLEYAPTYDNYKPRDYHFQYAVSDPHTGDHKSQWEVKTNGVVRGGYSLLEPDGTTRIVEYIADDDGFRALVKKIGTSVHNEVVPQVVPQIAHYGTYDGQIANYASGKEITPVLYQVPQNLPTSTINQVPVQVVPNEIRQQTIEIPQLQNADIQEQQYGRITAVPLQGQRLDGINLDNIEVVPYITRTINEVPSQGRNIEALPVEPIFRNYQQEVPQQVVPAIEGQNLGSFQGQNYNTLSQGQAGKFQEPNRVVPAQRQVVPNFNYQELNVGQIQNYNRPDLQQALPYAGNIQEPNRVVPAQGQVVPNLNYQELNVGQIQNYNRPDLQQALPYYQGLEPEVVPKYETVPFQGHNIEADVRVPIGANLPQPQIKIQNIRGGVPQQQVVPSAPGLVPTSPSYRTIINFQDLSDQNRLRKDVYHASYSEQVLKVVPSPNKIQKKTKKEFLIYYPDSEQSKV